MTEITENKVATIEGRNYEKSALSSSMYRLEDNVIMGFVLRAGIFESMKQEGKAVSPVIEVN